jgi:hypothetical protein
MKIIFLIWLLSYACSFKPKDEENREKARTQSKLETVSLDSDGDGENDVEEQKKGSDPFVADIPKFEGDFYQEMKLEFEFYNSQNRSSEKFGWVIKDNKIKLSWENKEYESSPGRIYMETLLKNYAVNNNFKKNQFRFYDYNEGIFSHSSPLIFEDTLVSISKKLVTLSKSGFVPNRVTSIIKTKFNITSNKFKSFRNPVFDIYYKSKDRQGLIFIESKKIDGTYNFNEENEIFIQFENFDSKIINESLLSGGANFFIKLRDFIIYDNDQTYLSLLEKVQSMSIPVTVAFAHEDSGEKTKIETIFVGTGGREEKLKNILKIAFKDTLLMTDSSIDQIRDLSNRQRSFGDSGENETLKWYVGSSEIGDNIFNHDFRPNQGIGLAYLSSKKINNTPLFIARTTLTNGQTATTGLLPQETKKIKIKIIGQKILKPFEKMVRIQKAECGSGNWQVNQSLYDEVQLGYEDQTNKSKEHILRDGYIKVSNSVGSLIEGNIGQLLNEGLIKLDSANGSDLDLVLSEQINQELIKHNSQVRVDIFLKPLPFTIRNGYQTLVSRNCVRERFDPPRGGDGGRAGGYSENYLVEKYDSGFGMAEGGVEVEYDLDIHVLSY